MSYSKQTWATGDTVTAAKLNHMEDGIAEAGGGSSGGGVFVVTADENGDCDASYNDVVAAFEAGKVVILKAPDASFPFTINYLTAYSTNGEFYDANFGNFIDLVASSATANLSVFSD